MISPIAEQISPAIAIPLPGLCFTRTIIENASPITANIPETYQKQQHTSDKIPSTRDAIANPDGLNVLWLAPCPFTSWYPALCISWILSGVVLLRFHTEQEISRRKRAEGIKIKIWYG